MIPNRNESIFKVVLLHWESCQSPTDAILVVHIMHLIYSQSLLLIQLLLLQNTTSKCEENDSEGVFKATHT